MKIELKPINSIVPYIRNPRRNEKAIPKVKASLKEFGFRQPIVVDTENVIVVGHTRWLAAKELGLKEVPIHVADNLTPAQIQAYRITDNRTNQESEFDFDLLKIELGELKASDFDLQLTGFDDAELTALLNTKEPVIESESAADQLPKAAELQQKWQVQDGDLYQCGDHRIWCGSCEDQEGVKRLLMVKPQLMLTDPPYGVKRDQFFQGAEGFGGKGKAISRRDIATEWDSERPAKATFDFLLSFCTHSIVWGGNFFADLLPMSTHWLVWDKHQTMPTFGDCELAWTSYDRKSVKQYDVEYNGLIGKEKERFHPTQKPVKLFAPIIDDYTDVGEVIFDPYAGSGTTLIAAEQTGRIALLIERQPEYVAVALERWSQLMNENPVKV